MEHLHHRFVASNGTGSDGALAIEATEVAATPSADARPGPTAGAEGWRPRPLADPARGRGDRGRRRSPGRAGPAAQGPRGRPARPDGQMAIQDVLPPAADGAPPCQPGLVAPRSQRRSCRTRPGGRGGDCRRADGLGVYVFGGPASERPRVDSVTAAERAFQKAQTDVDAGLRARKFDLVSDDQAKATSSS